MTDVAEAKDAETKDGEQTRCSSHFYLLINRSAGFVGNSPLFWRAGGSGYTPWIDEAERFTGDTADAEIRAKRSTHNFEKVHVGVIERLAKRTVDVQDLNREEYCECGYAIDKTTNACSRCFATVGR